MTDFVDPRNQSPEQFQLLAGAIGMNPTQTRRVLSEVLGKGGSEPEDWVKQGLLSKKAAAHFRSLPRLSLESIHHSEVDSFRKLVFRTFDGLAVETVIIPLHKEGKNSICLSSQVGCVMGCTFCATARMTNRRNLETWEMLDQFIQARAIVRLDGRRVSGAVFMGMGEPFLNYSNVISAAQLLSNPSSDSISAKAITISTVGCVQEIERFTDESHKFRLSISLGAATDEKRRLLVPVAARTPIQRVIQAARRHAETHGVRMMLSYVCIHDVNVSEEDAKELGKLLGDLPVRLVLIDVNDPTGRYLPPTNEELTAFRNALRKYLGQPVVRRYSGGGDIQAACGTLAGGPVGLRN